MEVQLRNLLQEVLSDTSDDGKSRVQSCFDIIERLSNKELSNSPNTVSSDIYILCCEAALAVKRSDLATKCLQLFFSRTIQMNQFVCRAYICQAQLIAPTDSANPIKFEEAAAYLLKATSIAKTNPKYYFLIYNSSLCYWTLARPLMRPGYRRFLSRSLSEITRTLDLIDDRDYDWRCQLMILLAESHLDGGRRAEATAASLSCLQLARLHAPKRLFDLLRFVVKNSLFDHQKFAREMKTSQSLALVYGLCRLKHYHDNPIEKSDKAASKAAPKPETQAAPANASDKPPEGAAASDTSASTTPATTTVPAPSQPAPTELVMAEPYVPSDEVSKIAAALFEQKSYMPPAFPVPQDPNSKAEVPRESKKHAKDPHSKKGSAKDELIESSSKEDQRILLLLEFCRICLDYGYLEYVKDALSCSKQLGISNADMSVKMSFIEAECKVKSLGEKQLSYSKIAVDTRSEAIRQCTEALAAAQRSPLVEPGTVEAGACILWNLCMPLCQPPFYSIVRRPLVAAIEALTAIGSLELRIMAQIESMIAKCEEDVEQNVTALERLERALIMDEASGGLHSSWLQASITRLRLRTELYRQPDRLEDQATMILEQCKSVSDSALSYADRRTLLVQVGNILAPEDFVMVVGRETEAMNVVQSSETASPIKVRGSTARSYLGSLMKLRAYGGKQVGAENFAERLRLWVDLCKASRKHEIWDVCRAAARFALIYDDDRISVLPPSKKGKLKPPGVGGSKQAAAPAPVEETPAAAAEGPTATGDEVLDEHPAFPTKDEITAFSNRELLRMIGEVRIILGEALVQLGKCHGYELYKPPALTDDMVRKHMKFVPDGVPLQDPDWLEYVKWMTSISDEAVTCFLRAGEHAKSLGEPVLAVNAAVCFWNYTTHLFAANAHRPIVNKLETALGYLRSLGHERSTGLVVDLCLAIATAYIQTWAPPPKPNILIEPERDQTPPSDLTPRAGGKGKTGALREKEKEPPQPAAKSQPGKKGETDAKGGPPKPGPVAKANEGFSSEAIADFKKALDVLEFGLALTDGHLPADVIPIGGRLPLIRTWLSVKQMLQQQLPKTLLPDRDLPDSHPCYSYQRQSRASCAVEILRVYSLSHGPTSLKDATTLQKAIQMVDACNWNDAIVRLEIYCQLARFCTNPSIAGSGPNPTADHALAVRCAQMALDTPAVKTPPKSAVATSEAILRAQAALVYGDSLIRSQGVLTTIRLQSCKLFCQAAKFAAVALDPHSAGSAMRQFWNNSLSLFRTAAGRKSLRPYITDLLANVKAACKQADLAYDAALEKPVKRKKKRPQEEQEQDADEDDRNTPTATTAAGTTREGEKSSEGPEDLTIRVSLYALLFQSFLDEGLYEDCLKVLDKALAELPRTKHRLLLFKHRIMTKARLGVSVKMITMDIHRFKAESEEQVAEMWKKVALSSINAHDQFLCYQNAIDTLQNPVHTWLKAELYIELAQLLHFHDRPVEDVKLHLKAAINLVMRVAVEHKPAPLRVSQETAFSSISGAIGNQEAKATKPKTKKQKQVEEKVDDTPKKPPEELQLCDLNNVRQLEVLLRAHIVMAVVAQRTTAPPTEQLEICTTAYAVICRIIKLLIESTVQVAKDNAKAKAAEEKERGKSPRESKRSKEDAAAAPEKPKRKAAIDFFPSTLDEWSMFELPDELLEVFIQGDKISAETVISTKSVPYAALTFRWLEDLESQFRALDLHHLCFPILCFQNILARTIYFDKTLLSFIHLKYEMLNYQLNLMPAAAFHEKLRVFYGDIQIQLTDQAKWRLLITEEAEQQANAADGQTFEVKDSAKVAERAALARRNLFLQKIDSHPSSLKILVDAAEMYLNREEYQVARQFLWEAVSLLKGVKEISGSDDLYPRCCYLNALLAYRERRFSDVTACLSALELEKLNVDEELLTKVIILQSRAIAESTNQKEPFEKARLFLIKMQPVLNGLHKTRKNQSAWLEALECFVEMRLAEVDFEILKRNHHRVQQSESEQIGLIIDRLMDCAEKLRLGGYRWECVEAIRFRLSALIWLADCLINDVNEDSDKQKIMSLRYQTLCKALECAETLVHWADEWNVEVMNVTPDLGSAYFQPSSVSLLSQRLVVQARMVASRIALRIFEIRVDEMRKVKNEEERKTAVLRVVEAFTEAKRPISEDEQRWEDATSCFPNNIFTWLKGAFHYSYNTAYMKAEVLTLLGRLTLLTAYSVSPDPPIQWEVVLRGIVLDSGKSITPQEESRATSRNTVTSAGEALERTSFNDVEVIDADGQHRQLTAMDLYNLEVMAKENAQAMDRSKRCLAQACEFLQQALTLSLKIGNRQLCATASIHLVELFGQTEPSLTAYYLMVHQNATTSLYLDELAWLSQPNTNASLQAALFNQLRNFDKGAVYSNLLASPLYRNLVKLLEQKSMAWKRLAMTHTQHDIIKEFPPNFTFLFLQHSPDHRFLYAAIPERQSGKAAKDAVKDAQKATKNAPPGVQAAQAAAMMQATSARVARLELSSPAQFQTLLANWRQADSRVGQVSLKHRYQADVAMKRAQMSATGSEGGPRSVPPSQEHPDAKPADQAAPLDESGDAAAEDAEAAEHEREIQGLEEDFKEQLKALDGYLDPLLKQLMPSLRPLVLPQMLLQLQMQSKSKEAKQQQPVRNPSAGAGGKRSPGRAKSPTTFAQALPQPASVAPTVDTFPPEILMILADSTLLELPLEAVELVRAAPFAAVGRDFSLELLWHRFKDDVTLEPPPTEEEGGKKAAKMPKLPSRVPALRDLADKSKKPAPGAGGAAAEGGKKLPPVVLTRQLPQTGCLPVDTHSFRYFIDVGQDFWPDEATAPVAVFQSVLEKYGPSFMQRWVGVTGSDHTPSPGEWEAYIRDGASGFIYYGTEHLASSLLPEKLGVLCAPGLWLMLAFDMAQTPTSCSRQSKLDLEKPPTSLALEKPVCAAGLMALAGVRSLVAARSMRTVPHQAQSSANILNLLLGCGLTTGQVIRLMNTNTQEGVDLVINPPPPPPPATTAGGEATKQSKPDAKSEARPGNTDNLSIAGERPPSTTASEVSVTAGPQRYQFSMVCYGLPNLVITQLPPPGQAIAH